MRILTNSFSIIVALLLAPSGAAAQEGPAPSKSASSAASWRIVTPQNYQTGVTVSGSVEDPNGAAVPKARLTLINRATGEARHTTADAAGGFSFENIAPGDYTLK